MSKSVLISIQPEWCKLISSGRKTVEVRKSRPKLETPFKVYIYCTKGKEKLLDVMVDGDECYNETYHGDPVFIKGFPERFFNENYECGNGKIIGEFICDKVYTYSTSLAFQSDNDISTEEIENKSCLSEIELFKYECPKSQKEFGVIKVGLFAWNISDLVIYDTPKELSEFGRYGEPLICSRVDCDKCIHWKYMRVNTDEYDYDCECNGLLDNFIPLKKPPQSWCYVSNE